MVLQAIKGIRTTLLPRPFAASIRSLIYLNDTSPNLHVHRPPAVKALEIPEVIHTSNGLR